MPQVEGGPSGLNRILEGAYRSAVSSGKDKGTASAIAWSAAKAKYKKSKGKWVRKLFDDLASLCRDISNPAFIGDRGMIKGVGGQCVNEYADLIKEEERATTDPEHSFTGESGPIFDWRGNPLIHQKKFLGPLADDLNKADIGIKPDAIGTNPITGINYDPGAGGSAGSRDGQEYQNENVRTTHGEDKGKHTTKLIDQLRDLSALLKGEWDESKHPRDESGKFGEGAGGGAGKEDKPLREHMRDLATPERASLKDWGYFSVATDRNSDHDEFVADSLEYMDLTNQEVEDFLGSSYGRHLADELRDYEQDDDAEYSEQDTQSMSEVIDRVYKDYAENQKESDRELHPRPEDVHDMGVKDEKVTKALDRARDAISLASRNKELSDLELDKIQKEWDEAKHPRDPDGKFGEGAGESRDRYTESERQEAQEAYDQATAGHYDKPPFRGEKEPKEGPAPTPKTLSPASVKTSLQNAGVHPDSVGKDKSGNLVIRRQFFYSYGKSAEDFRDKVTAGLKSAKIDHEVVNYGTHDAPFRGGASVANSQHWYVTVKAKAK